MVVQISMEQKKSIESLRKLHMELSTRVTRMDEKLTMLSAKKPKMSLPNRLPALDDRRVGDVYRNKRAH